MTNKYQACLKLASFIEENYPSICLIPTNEHKRPTFAFKGKSCEELWNEWYGDYGWFQYVCNHEGAGVSLLLRDDLIVIDCDDKEEAEKIEQCIPEFTKTPKQITKKGCHYFFKRGKICDENDIYCSIRPFENLSIDIITKRQEGKEAGMIAVYPSPNKEWQRSIFDTEILELPQLFVDFYKAKCKYPNGGSRKRDEPMEDNDADDTDVETKNKIDFETLKLIVSNLSDKTADEYKSWTWALWAIYNLSRWNGYIRKGRDLIHEFSAKSSKYNEDIVERYIDNADNRDDGVGLGTLMGYLKIDNEVMFHNIQAKLNPVKKVELNGYSFIEEPPFDMFDGKTRDYDTVKQVFEMRHFKVMRPLLYVEILDDGQCFFRDPKTVKDTFCNLYCNVLKVKGDKQKIEEKAFIDVWIKDAKIRTFETIDFLPPPLKCPHNTFNMWRGFDVERLDVISSGNIAPFLKHVSIWTNHDEQGSEYFLKWLADMFQNPGKLNGIAIVAKSEQGAGKNIFLEGLAKMMGYDLFYETAEPNKDLWSRFALGRKNRLLINIDETKGRDTYPMADVLKNMITSKFYNYEEKGKKPITLTNINRIIFTTNNTCSIRVEQKDRRYVVFECSQEMLGNKAYFDNLGSYFENPANQKAVYDYLMSIDVSNVDWIGERPLTGLYKDIQNLNAPNHIKFFIHMCENNSRDTVFPFEGVMNFFEYYKDILTKCGYSTEGFKKDKFVMDMRSYIKEGSKGDFEGKQCIRKVRGNSRDVYKFVVEDVRKVLVKDGYIKENDYMFKDDEETL